MIRNLSSSLILLIVISIAVPASAASIVLSHSNSDPNAGLNLELLPGQEATAYVWVTPDPFQAINSIGLNIASEEATLFSEASFSIDNPVAFFFPEITRWQTIDNGSFDPALGLLISDSWAVAVTTPGIDQQAITLGGDQGTIVGDATIHAVLTLIAGDAAGVATLTLEEGPFLIGDSTSLFTPSFNGGTITILEVPEPTSAALLVFGLFAVPVRHKRVLGLDKPGKLCGLRKPCCL